MAIELILDVKMERIYIIVRFGCDRQNACYETIDTCLCLGLVPGEYLTSSDLASWPGHACALLLPILVNDENKIDAIAVAFL